MINETIFLPFHLRPGRTQEHSFRTTFVLFPSGWRSITFQHFNGQHLWVAGPGKKDWRECVVHEEWKTPVVGRVPTGCETQLLTWPRSHLAFGIKIKRKTIENYLYELWRRSARCNRRNPGQVSKVVSILAGAKKLYVQLNSMNIAWICYCAIFCCMAYSGFIWFSVPYSKIVFHKIRCFVNK